MDHEATARILVVDDSTLIRRLATALLTPAGYVLDEAADAKAALHQMQRHHYDLIILDIMMPGLSGLDVARRMRSNDRTKDIPILFCTSVSDRETVLDAANLGPMDYVTKPLNRQVLLEKTAPLIAKMRESQKPSEEVTEDSEKLAESAEETQDHAIEEAT